MKLFQGTSQNEKGN